MFELKTLKANTGAGFRPILSFFILTKLWFTLTFLWFVVHFYGAVHRLGVFEKLSTSDNMRTCLNTPILT